MYSFHVWCTISAMLFVYIVWLYYSQTFEAGIGVQNGYMFCQYFYANLRRSTDVIVMHKFRYITYLRLRVCTTAGKFLNNDLNHLNKSQLRFKMYTCIFLTFLLSKIC
jgi:hypothetical protein